MKLTSVISMTAVAVLGAGLLAGCGSSSSTSADGASGDAGGATAASGGTIALSSPVMAQPGQQALANGFKAAAQQLGFKASVYDANLSSDTQTSNIATMVSQKVAGIASWALDDNAVAGAYSQAGDAKIPVVGINSAGTGTVGTVWWEDQTCDPGGVIAKLADYFAKAKPHGTIALISGPEAPSIVELTDCFSAAAKAAGLTIVSTQKNTQDTSAGASSLAQDLLSAHPDIDGFWAYNDASALGISSAVLAAGKTVYSDKDTSGILVTGINGDASAVDAIKAGTVSATVDTDPTCTGWAVAAATKDAIDNGKLTKKYVVASSIVDSANVASWVDPSQKTCSLNSLPLVQQ